MEIRDIRETRVILQLFADRILKVLTLRSLTNDILIRRPRLFKSSRSNEICDVLESSEKSVDR